MAIDIGFDGAMLDLSTGPMVVAFSLMAIGWHTVTMWIVKTVKGR